MSLRFAILTALTEKPSSGIELTRRFGRSIGYFWPASHQQIYRELDKLQSDGLIAPIDSAPTPTRGHPRPMTVTVDGTAALRTWAESDGPVRKVRDPMLVRVRAAAVLDDLDVRHSLEAQLADHKSRLSAYEEIDAKQFDGDLDRQARLHRLILQSGIQSEQLWVRWCQEILAELTDQPQSPPAP